MGLEDCHVYSSPQQHGDLLCAVCNRLISLNSYVMGACSHVVCKECCPPRLAKEACPQCHNKPGEIRKLEQAQPLAHRILGKIKVACPLRESMNSDSRCSDNHNGRGCLWMGEYQNLAHHLESVHGTAKGSATNRKAAASNEPTRSLTGVDRLDEDHTVAEAGIKENNNASTPNFYQPFLKRKDSMDKTKSQSGNSRSLPFSKFTKLLRKQSPNNSNNSFNTKNSCSASGGTCISGVSTLKRKNSSNSKRKIEVKPSTGRLSPNPHSSNDLVAYDMNTRRGRIPPRAAENHRNIAGSNSVLPDITERERHARIPDIKPKKREMKPMKRRSTMDNSAIISEPKQPQHQVSAPAVTSSFSDPSHCPLENYIQSNMVQNADTDQCGQPVRSRKLSPVGVEMVPSTESDFSRVKNRLVVPIEQEGARQEIVDDDKLMNRRSGSRLRRYRTSRSQSSGNVTDMNEVGKLGVESQQKSHLREFPSSQRNMAATRNQNQGGQHPEQNRQQQHGRNHSPNRENEQRAAPTSFQDSNMPNGANNNYQQRNYAAPQPRVPMPVKIMERKSMQPPLYLSRKIPIEQQLIELQHQQSKRDVQQPVSGRKYRMERNQPHLNNRQRQRSCSPKVERSDRRI